MDGTRIGSANRLRESFIACGRAVESGRADMAHLDAAGTLGDAEYTTPGGRLGRSNARENVCL